MTKEELLKMLGPTFKGTAIYDPVLYPFFIVKDQAGGWSVNRIREDKHGKAKFSATKYPGTFLRCLDLIAQEQLNESGKVFETIQEYIEQWKEICTKICNVYVEWNIKSI